MKVISIKYPTALSKVEDIENDNIDVFVELEDGVTYTLVVSTPKNYYWYMDKEGIDYYCGGPDIIVRRLTHDNIEQAIKKYAEDDAYWLKYFYASTIVDIDTLNNVIRKDFERYEEIRSQ